MRYFTSDTHFGHGMVSGLRGFQNVPDHDDHIISQIADLSSKDELFILGDLQLSRDLSRLPFLPRNMDCTMHLVLGNHDAGHPHNKGYANKLATYYAFGFKSVLTHGQVSIDGTKYMLSHFPYTRDRDEPRYLSHRLPDRGYRLLHGHLHDQSRRVGNEYHVGLDAHDMQFVSQDTIVAAFAD